MVPRKYVHCLIILLTTIIACQIPNGVDSKSKSSDRRYEFYLDTIQLLNGLTKYHAIYNRCIELYPDGGFRGLEMRYYGITPPMHDTAWLMGLYQETKSTNTITFSYGVFNSKEEKIRPDEVKVMVVNGNKLNDGEFYRYVLVNEFKDFPNP